MRTINNLIASMNYLSILDCKKNEDFWFVFSTDEGFFLQKVIINEGSKELLQKGIKPVSKVTLVPQNGRLCKGINLIKNVKRTNIFVFSGNGSSKVSNMKKNCVFVYSDANTKDIEPKILSSHEHTLNSTSDVVYNIIPIEGSLATVLQNKCIIVCEQFETEYKKALEKNNRFDIDTYDNKNGLCVIKRREGNFFIMTLGKNKGEIYIVERNSNIDLEYRIEYEKSIKAHDGNIAEIAINDNFTLIATASEDGTLIKVFDISGEPVQKFEFRRGSSRATIHSLSFNNTSTCLACSSSNGTVHIFDLNENSSKNIVSNLNTLGYYVPYMFGSRWMQSVWSFQNYHNLSMSKIICKFDENYNLIHVITYDGKYYYIYGDNFENISDPIDIIFDYSKYANYMTFSCKSIKNK